MVEPVEKLVQSAAYLLKGQEISVARVDVEPGPGAAQYHASSITGHGDKGKKSVNFFNTAVGILNFLIKVSSSASQAHGQYTVFSSVHAS